MEEGGGLDGATPREGCPWFRGLHGQFSGFPRKSEEQNVHICSRRISVPIFSPGNLDLVPKLLLLPK